ncbi:fungal-specific transcription factor domain-containing protein [Myxozyma melibiosi]|uniref:Fungal-specific transcription factor domain-containing protein n=1 Tax=Myxozyma melibiosi TaxID=54550 RepID=A0ABR1F705_9ASCO
MPDGSQSWKMIKPPGTQAGRIAQACDRCRSKKIRCDGKRPSCTQCTNVGFECRTSDKLSRRAFPRGYTESLEDHIRQLETENRNLKQMMDNWDDRMELVSRVESLSPSAKQGRKKTETVSSSSESDADELLESFCMHELQSLTMDGTYQGSSSGFAFADILRNRLKNLESSTCLGHMSSLFKTIDLSSTLPRYVSDSTSPVVPSLPPRVLADQLVDSFFRDWHPLFPILHIPTFRSDFQRLYSSSTLLGKEEFLVQLYLVFAISARQTSSAVPESADLYERQWRKLLCTIEHKNSLKTLQTLILAQIYTCLMGQDSDLWQFKMKAIGMALRLGLNRPKEQFSSHRLSPLELELRLRAFWSAFSLDAFSSAALGMPPILRLDDIACEYPTDIDDEFMSDKTEHCTPLPNKETKVSAAIELARFSRVLSRILTSLYYSPSNSTRSYNKILALDKELNDWRDRVVPHLKFEIKSPVPSSELRQHPRAPCLAIAYHYARILIHRPTVTLPESSDLRKSSILAMTESATAIIGITSHLRLRDLKFTLCVNQAKLLVSCGLIVLYSTIDVHEDRKVVGETRKVMCKCLAGICDNPGVSNVEYRAFENLSDAILGTPAAEITSPLPTFAKSEKLHGLVNSNDDLERIRASDGHIASITISRTPESDDGVLFHMGNEVDSTNTLSILQRIDGGRKRR